MFGYQCAKCSQDRLTSHHYTTSVNDNTRRDSNTDNTRRDINSAAGRTHHTNCNPVKPTQLPGIHTIFSPRYPVYINDCDRPANIDLKCDTNTKSTINDPTAEGSSLVKLDDNQDNFSTPQHDDDIPAHGSGHVREESDVCITCRKPLSKQLVVHNLIHTGEKSFSCEKGFPKQVTKHNRAHKGKKRYPCLKCSKSFTTKSSLCRHNSCAHKCERRYCCEICGKLFNLMQVFLRHNRTHNGEKPYCCETCGKSFIREETLTVHIRIHTGEKPYLCTVCRMQFAHSSSLHNHMKSQHKQLNSPESLL